MILIVMDTVRADHLGAYGYALPTSNAIDRWATAGVLFERAFTPSPWTLPTFGSILSGQLPGAHLAGRRPSDDDSPAARVPFSENAPTLAQELGDAGFATAAFVSSNAYLKARFGIGRGFAVYDWVEDEADQTVDRAVAWIDKREAGPFFLLLHLMDPHVPYRAPEPYRGRFSSGGEFSGPLPRPLDLQRKPGRFSAAQWAYVRGRYDEGLAFTDQELGRFFREIEPLLGTTLVILTSDHGEELFDHGGFAHGHSMFQEVLRVPLIIRGPGVRSGRDSEPVSLLDLKPTVLEAVGLPTDSHLIGRSLWKRLRIGETEHQGVVIAETTLFGSEKKAIVRWPHKLIWEPATGRRLLFDLEADPDERNDLAEVREALADRLEAELRRWLQEAPPVDSGLQAAEMDEETQRQLRALGYVD